MYRFRDIDRYRMIYNDIDVDIDVDIDLDIDIDMHTDI